ncbi:unnamed protein product, partial [Thlaspi arvense]
SIILLVMICLHDPLCFTSGILGVMLPSRWIKFSLISLPIFLELTFLGFVEAEENPEISEAYAVAAVPYFVFFKGADPSSLANKVGEIAGSTTSSEPASPASLGLAAGPTILETVKENAKATAKDRAQPLSTTTDALKTRPFGKAHQLSPCHVVHERYT